MLFPKWIKNIKTLKFPKRPRINHAPLEYPKG